MVMSVSINLNVVLSQILQQLINTLYLVMQIEILVLGIALPLAAIKQMKKLEKKKEEALKTVSEEKKA